MNTINWFDLSNLFDAFVGFVAVFLIYILVDKLIFNQHRTIDVDKRTHGRQNSFRFCIKRMIARLLLKLNKRDDLSDELRVFSEQDEMPVDAVYFNTNSENGQILLFGTARRKHGLVNTLGMIKVPEFSDKFLVLPVYPDSSLYQTDKEQTILDCYTVAGLKIKPIIPKKEYHIEYDGTMKLNTKIREEFDVKVRVVWRSNLPVFNYATDVSPSAMSEAMAREPWSREYFENLKSRHQTHIEQFGDLEGSIQINGHEFTIKTNGVRDHTVGARRDWNEFHQYVLHFFRLINGDSISILVISVPVMFRRFVAGFMTNKKGNTNIPIDSCSIDLNEIDKQNPPDDYEFDFIANNDSYRVHVTSHSKITAHMGEQQECCLIEKWCDCKINGVKGWGAIEWQYKTEPDTRK